MSEALLKPKDLGLVIKTSDVTVYDGYSLTNVVITADNSLNGILRSIDLKLEDIDTDHTDKTSQITFDGAITFGCTSATQGDALEKVINDMGAVICSNNTAITNMATSNVSYDGLAVVNYTPTAGTGVNSQLEGIDDEIGVINTALALKASVTDLDNRVIDLTIDDWVSVGGAETSSGASLFVTIDDGAGGSSTYYVDGTRVVKASQQITCAATKDNYLDIDSSGNYNVTSVTIGAGAPPVVGMRLWKFETDATGVQVVTDLRALYPYDGTLLADNTVDTRHITALSVTGAKMEDIVSGATKGDSDFITFTYDDKGRITAASDKFNIGALSDLDILRYDLATDKWINTSIGTVPASGTTNETLRWNGSSWAADSTLVNTSSKIGINIPVGEPQSDLTVGYNSELALQLRVPQSPAAAGTTGGSLGAGTYYYVVTALTGSNETTVSVEVSATIDGATQTAINIVWTETTLAEKYRVYKGVASQTYTEYFEVFAPSYTDDATAGTAGTPPTTDITANAVTINRLGVGVGEVPDGTKSLGVSNISSTVTSVASFNQAAYHDTGAPVDTYTLKLTNTVANVGQANYGADIAVSGSDTNNYGINITASTSSAGDNIGIKINALNAGAGDEYAILVQNGMVGLGTLTPTKQLEVFGSFLIKDVNNDSIIETSNASQEIGFFAATPVVQQSDTVALTDNSGGTANDTVVAISGSGADSDINDNFADLTAKYNALRTLLRNYGLMA